MALSLKAELDIWAAALKAYDGQDFPKSLKLFSRIADSSKILTNMGLIYATVGEHDIAVQHFNAAISLDNFLAIAHFQCGVSNFLLSRYVAAYTNFDDAHFYLRGNPAINYEQLGLKFKLFSAEVLFNRGLSQIYLGYNQEGMNDLKQARNEKVTEEHDVIDEAIRDRGDRYTVFSIPVGVLYRPAENKLKNIQAKDYLGKAKLVAASDVNDVDTKFSGITKYKQQSGTHPDTSPKSRKADEFPVFNRSITAPAHRTTSIESTQTLERPRTTNDIPQAQERRPPPLRPPPFQCCLPPTSTPRSSPSPNSKSSLTQNSGFAAQTQTVSPLSSQISQQPPRSPTSPTQVIRPQAHLLASRRSQSVSHAPSTQMKTNVNRDGAATGLVRSNTSTGVMKESRSGPTKQGMKVEIIGGTDQRQLTPASSRFAEFYDEYVGAYTGNSSSGVSHDTRTIRIKLHYQGEVRGMNLPASTLFSAFTARVAAKFGVVIGALKLSFMDEDSVKITLRDEEDWDLAMETAMETGISIGGQNGKTGMEGRLEVWCEEI